LLLLLLLFLTVLASLGLLYMHDTAGGEILLERGEECESRTPARLIIQ